MAAPETFVQFFEEATAVAGELMKPEVRSSVDEDGMPFFAQTLDDAFDEIGCKLGLEWQPLVDTHNELGEGEEKVCGISLGDAKFLFQVTTEVGDVVASAMTNTVQVRVSKKSMHEHETPVARCEILIEGVNMPAGWLELPALTATVLVFNPESVNAFYVMKDLQASDETLDVPDMNRVDAVMTEAFARLFPSKERTEYTTNVIGSDDFGKDDRVTFGAHQEALLMAAEEFANYAVFNVIKVNSTTANFSLTTITNSQAGIFADHHPASLVELLTKRNIITAPEAFASKKSNKRTRE